MFCGKMSILYFIWLENKKFHISLTNSCGFMISRKSLQSIPHPYLYQYKIAELVYNQ
jgi:hypothetical protein